LGLLDPVLQSGGAAVKPKAEKATFGTITIDGQSYGHDVVIRLDGKVTRRKKALSKKVYGTSHMISLAEAEQVFQEGAERLIIGSGHFGQVQLSAEAADFFKSHHLEVTLEPTPLVLDIWNESQGKVIGLFHLTC
jgi:hypothetical protein